MFRIGIGYDTHRLIEGRPLILGGLRIESQCGAEGHSDADALTHALADAILGRVDAFEARGSSCLGVWEYLLSAGFHIPLVGAISTMDVPDRWNGPFE